MVNIGVDMQKQSWRVTALVEGEVAFTGTLAKLYQYSFPFHGEEQAFFLAWQEFFYITLKN
jgi:hypothetical protein